ncbi:MAG: hypothetical protein AB1571_03945 [Nanoarchaeota archaeon]
MEFKQIIYAILVVIVIIFAVFFLTKGSPLIKSVLNLGDEFGFETGDTITIKEKFDSLTNSYKECAESEKADCICRRNFPRFPSGYILSYSSSQDNSIISISKEAEVTPIYKELLEGLIINCFAVLEKDEKGNYKYSLPPTTTILIEQSKSGELTIAGVLGEEKFDDKLIPGLEYIYKYDKQHLCLLLEKGLGKGIFKKPDETAINYFKNLPLCA